MAHRVHDNTLCRPVQRNRRTFALRRRAPLLAVGVLLAVPLLAACGDASTDDVLNTTTSRSTSPSHSPGPTTTSASPPPTDSPSSEPTDTKTEAGSITLTAPKQATLPAGAFAVTIVNHTTTEPALSAGPTSVCRVRGAKVEPLRTGTCTVTAAAGGLTSTRSVVVVKGTPKITWALKATTPHSNDPRKHGIRSNSDGSLSLATLTPLQCTIQGTSIKAVGQAIDGTQSLGACKVEVKVPETPMWSARRVILTTTVVEAAIVMTFTGVPESVSPGETIRAVVRFTQPDASLDRGLGVTIRGCGAADAGSVVDREVVFSWQVPTSLEDVTNGTCTVKAGIAYNGTTRVIGSGGATATVRVVSPTSTS